VPPCPGTKVILYYEGKERQFADHSIYHGYSSTVESEVHFGLGIVESVDSVRIVWPDGKYQSLTNIPIDCILEVDYSDAVNEVFSIADWIVNNNTGKAFEPVADSVLMFEHSEQPFDDYQIQATLPYQLSQQGPGIAIGDIDGNGTQDIFVGGGTGQLPMVFLQEHGRFKKELFTYSNPSEYEDAGILLFDADGDTDLDLYVVSGGIERMLGSPFYRDRLYENDGNGHYKQVNDALPDFNMSGSCVRAADFDRDGDLDLFVGGRLVPGRYPEPPGSIILRNDSRPGLMSFMDVTRSVAGELEHIGMINDALWTDFNNDYQADLVLAGEWMPIVFLVNEGGRFRNVTEDTGISEHLGWWNSLAGGDFDNDGDIDYVAGNLGLNSIFKASQEFPVMAYSSDFDNDGRYDVIVSKFSQSRTGVTKSSPVHLRVDIARQLESMDQKFPSYQAYSVATLDSMFSDQELRSALQLKANFFSSVFIKNLGNEQFEVQPLPLEAQLAPLYGILPGDFNEDTSLDLLLVGNSAAPNPFWGPSDALNGLLLEGDGTGSFTAVNYTSSGFFVPGFAKSMVQLPNSSGENMIVVSQNNGESRLVQLSAKRKIRFLDPSDAWGLVHFADGGIRKMEFYYGNTYLSQDARFYCCPPAVERISIFDFYGRLSDEETF